MCVSWYANYMNQRTLFHLQGILTDEINKEKQYII